MLSGTESRSLRVEGRASGVNCHDLGVGFCPLGIIAGLDNGILEREQLVCKDIA